MKHALLLRGLVVLLLCGGPSLAASPPPPADTRPLVTPADLPPLPDEQTVPFGKEVDGLACRLITPADVAPGQPIRLVVQVRNNSDRLRYICDVFHIEFPEQAALAVTGPDGKPIKQARTATSHLSPERLVPIKPGETRRFDVANAREFFASWTQKDGKAIAVDGFAAEGKYSLTYTYRCPKCPERFDMGTRTTEKDGKRIEEKIYAEPTKDQRAGAWAGTLTATAPMTVRPVNKDDLTVHEWGVFTVFNDLKLANVNRKAEWGSLPAEFYRQFPERRLRWVPAAWDKPIVYFYTKQPSLFVDVQVRFSQGAPVVWWPACQDPIDDGMGRGGMVVKRGETSDKVFDRLHWAGWLGATAPACGGLGRNCNDWVKVSEFPLPKESWLHDARLKDAAPITVIGSKLQRSAPWVTDRPETERFIFYDGLMPAPDYLRCVRVTDTAVTVKNTAPFPLGPLFLVDRRSGRRGGDGTVAIRVEAIAPGTEATLPLERAVPERLQKFTGDVRTALLGTGLFEAEANSILKIWHGSFFEAEGLTAFYLLPQAEYDRLLPLQVSPRPAAGPVRVGIALHPAFENGPVVRERVAQLIRDLDSAEFGVREAATRALEQMGPWAVAQLQEALKGKPSLETSRRLERLLERADASEWLRQAAPPAKK